MAAIPSRRLPFEIPCDSSNSGDDDHSSHNSLELNDTSLGELSVLQVQNRQSSPLSAASNETIDSLTTSLRDLRIDAESRNNWNDNPKNQGRRRLTRPAISANTFEVLETVPEYDPKRPSSSVATTIDSNETQRHLDLPITEKLFPDHPLVEIARKGIPPVEEQIAKHRDGYFQGILSTRVRVEAPNSEPKPTPSHIEVHFGFNLLPIQEETTECEDSDETITPPRFTILISPLAPGEELRAKESEDSKSKEKMALAEPNHNHVAPAKEPEALQVDGPRLTSSLPTSPAGDKEKHIDIVNARSPVIPIARIEDSVEALDELEEQLEAFDEAAHIRRIVSPEDPGSERRPRMQSLSVKTADTARSITPQSKRTTLGRSGSASVRIKSTSEPRRTVRKAASMIFLDSPKIKIEDKPAAQAPPKKSTIRSISSLLPPKQPPKSAKKPTIPTFELPGDEVARKLKEKREARASTQFNPEQAIKPTVSSLRRAKSAKAPTRPNFELPGEAISRRKREEREAQLKAQEEEERKRREFKARPIRSGAAPSTFPRETVASRARQNKGPLVENSTHQVSPNWNKGSPSIMDPTSRSPLSKTNNQSQQSRGRGLHPEPAGTQPSRGTSSSSTVGSLNGQRSSVSTEDVQHQRLRGQEIYKRDNSWTSEREREKREREALAKLAREEAAERSRQKSREWAAKQARKRMTIASLRDVMTST
ncbi:uncharacterized protein F4822DRAFT_257731 [Hypoxylon trugodes]|uniref:uncharacterized protein n=1 Tax=Hypoxylon trugodes TaxID=326681 RepID=UPI002191AD05|nr:uncharacterized protein F4822DRAFT_257731 [Hypoxylon trugodes]KAI1388785.1 hypothetical protein F4822DRAFT_257731 [Hypoxylon trugodes]